MKITLVRKGIFGKKYLRLPDGFLKNHEEKSGKATPIYGQCNDDFIIVSTSERALEKKECYVKELLTDEIRVPDELVKLVVDGEEVPYKEVVGFFSFRGEVYYKVKGGAGKLLSDGETNFTNDVRDRFPEEFDNYTMPKMGNIMVKPLKVM